MRVALDYELKRNLNRDIALQAENTEIARNGKALPSVKDWFSRRQNSNARPPHRVRNRRPRAPQIDLELATRNYRPRAIAAKAKAGFSIYASREDASKLRRILDESELTARIFSL